MKRQFTCFYIIALFLIFPHLLAAKSTLSVTDYDLSAYPLVKSHFLAFDSYGNVVNDLSQSDFSVTDNSAALPVTGLSCPEQDPFSSVSVVVSFDLGMRYTGDSHFDMAKTLAKGLFNSIPLENSECALASFDTYSYLDQDYTQDKNKLSAALANLSPKNGSLYDSAFLSRPSGSIPLAALGKYNKSIILITDGLGSASANSITDLAKQDSVRIFCVSLSAQISDELKTISTETGGKWFEGIDNSEKINETVLILKSLVFNNKPCEISWLGGVNCPDVHSVRISARNNEFVSDIKFSVPDSQRPQLGANPQAMAFGSVLPGASRTLQATFTALNSDITITGFSISPANNDFSITAGGINSSPLVLKKGESHTVDIKFSPVDSSLVFTRLLAESNACPENAVLITGGFPNTPPRERNLTIVSPNGGEQLFAGDTAKVKWTGLLPSDVIQLEYSVNNGRNWDTLTNDITGLEYKWLVPDRPSDSCLVRVVQLWPNNIGRTMDFRHPRGVNSANFNKEGNLVITTCKDSVARIWNSNNGALVLTLHGHTGPVLWANFDNNDKYAVTSSSDSTVKIWDISNGAFIRTLFAHTDIVRCANFSPDGKSVVTVSADGSAFVWDVATATIRDTVAYHGNQLWFASYSPKGTYIAVTDYKGTIKIWDVASRKLYKTLYPKIIGSCTYIAFSPDESCIASASWGGRAFVWDIAKGDTLYSVTHSDTSPVPVNSVSFDYSGKVLLTSGLDYVANMWNAKNGLHIARLKEHTSSVQSAVFNFDASRILTSSWDSTAKIWNLDKRDLQMDSSDNVFSIGRADIAVNDIDFGIVSIASLKDSTLSPFIKNNTKYRIPVKDIKITGENASDFSLVEPFSPFTLDSMAASDIEIRFKPGYIGFRKANLEITISGQKIVKSLSGEGTSPSLRMIASYIDFGQVALGDYKDTTITAVFRNVSIRTINISKISQAGPDSTHFHILEGGTPVSLSPGSSLAMKLRFTPEFEGRLNGSILFEHDGQGSPSQIHLIGEGIDPRVDTATIYIESVEGVPGSIVEVPVRITNLGSAGLNPAIKGFTCELKFNSSMLEPLDNSFTSRYSNGDRILSFNLPSTISQDSTLGKLSFRVALGNDTITDLKLMNTAPLGKGRIVLNEGSGKFTLKGTCKEGGTRLFESDGRIYLDQNKPNPAQSMTTIDFGVIENGHTLLYITDLSGKRVKTLVDKQLIPGRYQYYLDTQDLPQGTYFYILETPTYKTSRKMNVER